MIDAKGGTEMIKAGTPIPNSIIEAKSQGSSEVKRYFLSPNDLEEIQRIYPTIKRGNGQMLNLTKEQYLNERKAGKSRNQIVKDQKISPPVLYKALETWGIKEQSAEQEALAALNQASVAPLVKEQTAPTVIERSLVRLPKEVAEAIEFLRGYKDFDNDQLYEPLNLSVCAGEIKHPHFVAIKNFVLKDIKTYFSALVNGYEVEQTPEEKAIQWLIDQNYLQTPSNAHVVVGVIKSILGGEMYAS